MRIFIILLLANIGLFAQVSVNETGNTPDASSILDVNADVNHNKGILIPRLTQSQRDAISNPATSLIIYQTDNNPGFYFYDGSNWIPLFDKNFGWSLTGNDGTTSGTNFLGTTDNTDLVFKTNGNEVMRLTNSANVGIGITTPDDKLDVSGNMQVGGYLRVGNASSGSITRHAVKELYWQGDKYADDNTVSWTIGTLDIPAGASSITVKNIYCAFDGYHPDGDEGYSVKVKIGGNYIGMSENNVSGFVDVDWHFNSNENALNWNYTSSQNVNIEIEDCTDGSCWGSDDFHANHVKVLIYYDYSLPLQSGEIAATGRIYANDANSVGDLAEHFSVEGAYLPGMLISYNTDKNDQYKLSDTPYDPYFVGVVSSDPSVVLNSPDKGVPVALVGRVEVKLKDSKDLIKKGDFLTTSDVEGLAEKATEAGYTIGFAVEDQKKGSDKVMIMLQPDRYWIPKQKNISTKSQEQTTLPARKFFIYDAKTGKLTVN